MDFLVLFLLRIQLKGYFFPDTLYMCVQVMLYCDGSML